MTQDTPDGAGAPVSNKDAANADLATHLVAKPIWMGPWDGAGSPRSLGGTPGSTVIEFSTWSDEEGRPTVLSVAIGGLDDAVRWAEMLGWSGAYCEGQRGGIFGFEHAVRVRMSGALVTSLTVIAVDEDLSSTEFRHLFAIEWTAADPEKVRIESALERIRSLAREGHEANLRRQLRWLAIREGEVLALQTIGRGRRDPNYLALARGIDDAVRLTNPSALIALNRWGKTEPIAYQGVYVIGNRLVGRMDEVFVPGVWGVMPEGVVTDARIASRRMMYLDLDTQRRDEQGRPVDLPISATRDELHKTIARSLVILEEIVAGLAAIGIDRPADVIAFMMSGNGVQLWLALADLPESDDLHALVRELLAIWAVLYDGEVSHVDAGVHDAKRIGPLAGTAKRKGVRSELHRLVTFDGSECPRRVTLAELRALVALYRRRLTPEQRAAVAKTLGVRAAPPPPSTEPRRGGGLAACNQVPIRDVAAKLAMDTGHPICPWCESGGGSDVAFLDERGANILNCKHARCAARPNKTCVDLVAKVALGCDNIAGTKGVVTRVLGWFSSNFGLRGRS